MRYARLDTTSSCDDVVVNSVNGIAVCRSLKMRKRQSELHAAGHATSKPLEFYTMPHLAHRPCVIDVLYNAVDCLHPSTSYERTFVGMNWVQRIGLLCAEQLGCPIGGSTPNCCRRALIGSEDLTNAFQWITQAKVRIRKLQAQWTVISAPSDLYGGI